VDLVENQLVAVSRLVNALEREQRRIDNMVLQNA
jgi:hypothetical protein